MNTAFIFVNCHLGSEIQTIKYLKELCVEVQGTFGIYDFICKLNYENMEFLEEILQKIRRIDRVIRTITIHTIPEQS